MNHHSEPAGGGFLSHFPPPNHHRARSARRGLEASFQHRPSPDRLWQGALPGSLHRTIAMAEAAPLAPAQAIAARPEGAPLDLVEEHFATWQEWNGAKDEPVFERVGGKLVLKARAKNLATYAPFILLAVTDGELYAKCAFTPCCRRRWASWGSIM